MARKVQLKNKSGQKIYPLTSSANVMMSDKSGSLDGKLSELELYTFLFQELYIDFSQQSQYKASDISKCTVARNIDGDWYALFYNSDDTVICGDHKAIENDYFEATRNNIFVKAVVNWDRISEGRIVTFNNIKITSTDSLIEKNSFINYKMNIQPLKVKVESIFPDLGVYEITNGYNISSINGALLRDANYSVIEDYIDISNNILAVEGAVLNRVSYYNADKVFVLTHVSPTINKDYVTQNAFARVAFLNSDNTDGYDNLRVYNSVGAYSLKEQITQVQGNVTAMEKRISNVSDNADANTILREIYVDFSRQETYSAADINRFYLNRNNNGDWYLFICKDNTIVCGGHTYIEEPTGIVKYTRNNIDLYAIINWNAVPTEAKDYSYDLSFHALDNLDYSPSIKAGLISDNMEPMVNEIIEEGLQDLQTKIETLQTNEKFINAIQVSDGLSLTSASAPQIGFDDTAALVGVASQAAWLEYGESYQQIRLDIFQVSQPTNVRHVIVAKQGESIGGSETFSISTEVNVLALGNRVWRTMFQHKNGWWYRDYHFDTETLDDAVEMKFKDGESEAVSITVDTRKTYVASKGYDDSAVNTNIMTSSYYRDSETKRVYGCWTGYDAHAILFYSDDNLATIIPFAIFPNTVQYEASIVYVGSRLHIITRGANSVAYSDDNGSNWEITPITADNNRPRLYNYNGKPIWMHGVSGRSRITAKYGDDFNTAETLFDLTSYWGCVYPSLLVWGGDMYIAYSDRQLHLADNWAKDAIKFMYAGKIE